MNNSIVLCVNCQISFNSETVPKCPLCSVGVNVKKKSKAFRKMKLKKWIERNKIKKFKDTEISDMKRVSVKKDTGLGVGVYKNNLVRYKI